MNREDDLKLSVSDSEWLEFVQNSQDANIFHRPAWAQLLAACYRFTVFVIAVRDADGRINAGVPVAEIHSHLTGRRWDSLPYSDHCAPLYRDTDALQDLTVALVASTEANGISSMTVRAALASHPDVHPVTDFVIHTLPLDCNPEQTLGRLGHSHRQNVRTATKRGVRVEWANTIDGMRAYYDLQLQTRRRHGVPVQPWRYFSQLFDSVISRGLGFVLLAYHEEECLAGAVFLHWNTSLVAKYAASREDSLGLRPNELVFWTAMRWGCVNGFTSFDFGRTEVANEGLREFKRRWGAVETPCCYSIIGQQPTAVTNGPLSRAMHTVIQHSPPWVCRAAGEMFYGHFG